jgi:hypothetical protein
MQQDNYILDSHHDTLNLAKLNRDLGEYYRNIIIKNGGKRKKQDAVKSVHVNYKLDY